MFHFPDTLFVCTLLNILMSSVAVIWVCLLDGACGLKTRTSRYVLSNRPPQKPLATTSRQAPSWVMKDVHTSHDFPSDGL